MDQILQIHSLVRFLILLVAVAGIIKTLAALLMKAKAERIDQVLASTFLGLYDVQALLGLLVIFLGGLSQALHPVVMIVGLAAAHGLQSMTRRATESQIHVRRLALYIVPLVIILIGLAVLPA